jgi:hypothetical protein
VSAPRVRTVRCDHGFAKGLCENANCPHAATDAGKPECRRRKLAAVVVPRCCGCRRQTVEAVPRGEVIGVKNPHRYRYCDHCWEEKQQREAQQAQRAHYFDRRAPMRSAEARGQSE